VAILALHRGVGTQQRETVLVIFDLLRGYRPALNRMALLAIRTHLSAVHIALLVTVSAVFADVLKDRLHMARDALHLLVHAAKRIIGLVVVELGNGADGPPTRRSVTVLTGYCQRAVRIARGFVLWVTRLVHGCSRCCRYRLTSARERQQGPESELE